MQIFSNLIRYASVFSMDFSNPWEQKNQIKEVTFIERIKNTKSSNSEEFEFGGSTLQKLEQS